MNIIESIKEKFEEIKQKHSDLNSWEKRYERLNSTEYNKKARKNFQKAISTIYADGQLSEEQEAILFSQSYHQLLLKNPAASKFPDFDEYEVEKTDATYINKGFWDSTNSYGAQVREKHEYEVCKFNNEWTCITDVGTKYLKRYIILFLPVIIMFIIASCSILSY